MAAAPILLLIALVAWFGPVEISGTIRLDGKVFPASSWTMERSGQGTLTAILRDRETGVTRSYAVQSVERGDVAILELAPYLRVGSTVARGDTIAVLRSAESDARLAELEGKRSIAEREAAAVTAGEKEALVLETRTRLEQARDLVVLQRRIVERIRTLADQSLASAAELDEAQSELVSREGEIEVLLAEIDVLESGGRPEDRQVASARLDAARRRLEALLRSRALLAVRAPIDGVVTRSGSDSVLVAVVDTSNWVVAAALPESERARVRAGQPAQVILGPATARATVLDVNPVVERLAGKQVLLTTISVGEPLSGAIAGLRVQVRIEARAWTLQQWVRRQAESLFDWRSWFTNRG